MKLIRYNLASQKRVHFQRVFLISSVLVIISLFCIAVGLWKLLSENKLEKTEINEVNILREKFSDVSRMIADYRNKINGIKKKWGKKINFSNSLINQKKFSMIEILNDFENLIPDNVFMNDLNIINNSKSGIQIQFMSPSFKNLLNLYKNLSKYNIVIKNESVLQNKMCQADLVVKIKDEKN